MVTGAALRPANGRVWSGSPPAGVGELPEPFVDPGAAFAGGLDQVRDGRAARPGRNQGSPQRGFRIAADLAGPPVGCPVTASQTRTVPLLSPEMITSRVMGSPG